METGLSSRCRAAARPAGPLRLSHAWGTERKTRARATNLYNGLVKPTVQISLDLTDIDEAVSTAAMAVRAGVDWLEVGTPLIIAHGMHGVRDLKARWPEVPIVADLKTMDGGWLEAEMMARAGASMVVVMGQA